MVDASINECKGNPELASHPGLKIALSSLEKRIIWESQKNQASVRAAIYDGFAAIPPDFQMTFLQLGGQIIVANDANVSCTTADRIAAVADDKNFSVKELKALSEGLSEVSACYKFMPPSLYKQKTGKNGQLLTIVISDSATEVKHSFVRSFGYLVSQMYSRLVIGANNEISWLSTENPDFRARKDRIASSFLQDIKGTASASRFAKYVSDGDADAKDRRSFADFVYAEAFDSYYCNAFDNGAKNTRSIMETRFKKTFQAFEGGNSGKLSLADDQLPEDDSSPGLALAGNKETQGDDSLLDSAVHAVRVGRVRSFFNSSIPIHETMHSFNWYRSAEMPKGIDPKQYSKQESGFNLGWFDAVTETWQGAGILYNDYYDRTYKATGRAINSAMAANGGNSPGVIGTVAAMGKGVSDGSGYTGVYNNIQKKTDNIYKQVQQGRGTNQPLGYIDSASVVLNATVDQIGQIPGPIGSFTGIAKNGVSAGSGGTFDRDGNFKELSNGERFVAGGSALIGLAGETGATKAMLNSAMSSGGAIKRFGQANAGDLSGFGQATFESGGKLVQRANIANTSFVKALNGNEMYKTLSTAKDFAGTSSYGVPSLGGMVNKGLNSANGAIGKAIDAPSTPPTAAPKP